MVSPIIGKKINKNDEVNLEDLGRITFGGKSHSLISVYKILIPFLYDIFMDYNRANGELNN